MRANAAATRVPSDARRGGWGAARCVRASDGAAADGDHSYDREPNATGGRAVTATTATSRRGGERESRDEKQPPASEVVLQQSGGDETKSRGPTDRSTALRKRRSSILSLSLFRSFAVAAASLRLLRFASRVVVGCWLLVRASSLLLSSRRLLVVSSSSSLCRPHSRRLLSFIHPLSATRSLSASPSSPTMLKALQFYNDAKTEIGAGAKLAPYVRLFMLGACGITLVLGLISLILSNFTGIIVMYEPRAASSLAAAAPSLLAHPRARSHSSNARTASPPP